MCNRFLLAAGGSLLQGIDTFASLRLLIHIFSRSKQHLMTAMSHSTVFDSFKGIAASETIRDVWFHIQSALSGGGESASPLPTSAPHMDDDDHSWEVFVKFKEAIDAVQVPTATTPVTTNQTADDGDDDGRDVVVDGRMSVRKRPRESASRLNQPTQWLEIPCDAQHQKKVIDRYVKRLEQAKFELTSSQKIGREILSVVSQIPCRMPRGS